MADALSNAQLLEGEFFESLGLASLPDGEKEAILASISRTVTARVYKRIVDSLEEAEVAELESKSGSELVAYLEQNGFDLAPMLVQESVAYRIELMASFDALIHGKRSTDQVTSADSNA